MLQLFVMSRFTRSKYIEQVPKLKRSAPGTPFGLFCHSWDGTCQGLFMHQIWSF